MKRVPVLLTVLASLTAMAFFHTSVAQEKQSALRFETYGFEMEPLEVETEKTMTTVQMFLEPYGGFAASVSVQVQIYGGNMSGYLAQAKVDIEKQGWTLVSIDKKGDWPAMEYYGKSGNRNLHWYTRALKKGPRLYIVTATALESRWEIEKETLIANVDSFSLIEKD